MSPMKQARTFLAPIGSGVGDVVVAMPVLRRLIADSDKPVFLVARGPRQLGFEARIAGLAGCVREVDLARILQKGDTYINLRDHQLQKNYDWYGEKFAREYPGFHINDIMREVCSSFSIYPDFSQFPRFSFNPLPQYKNVVALVPGTTVDSKSWPSESWCKLHDEFRRRGQTAILLGEPQRSGIVADLIAIGIEHVQTPSIGDAIDVISSSAAVVSVDTGLMHIAVQQGIPTVALFNSVHTYFREASHCRAVLAPDCADECRARFTGDPHFPVEYKQWVWSDCEFDSCKAAVRCMTRIPVDEVLEAFAQLTRGCFAQR